MPTEAYSDPYHLLTGVLVASLGMLMLATIAIKLRGEFREASRLAKSKADPSAFADAPELGAHIDRLYLERRVIREQLLQRRAWFHEAVPEDLLARVDALIEQGVELAAAQRDVQGDDVEAILAIIARVAEARVALEQDEVERPAQWLAMLDDP